MDFGYSVDSTSIVALYKYNDSYIFDEVLYKTGMLNRDISSFIKNNHIEGYVYADSAEPKSIAEIRLSGVDIFPVTKGRDSIVYGINLINQNEVFVTHRSKNLKKELEGYIWMKDKQGNSLQKPNPMTGDHAIDAARYAMMMVLENPNRGTYYLY
jgi:phage terminase large subunit